MVVFTCQHCNASLKRVAVQKHYDTVCRNARPYLTCIDCLKDFSADNFNDHMTCITEDERYGGKDFKAKATAVKQTAWIDVVYQCAQENRNMTYKSLFSKLSSSSNVPRKKAKFLNFIYNSLPMCDERTATEVFEIIEEEFLKAKKVTPVVETQNHSENSNEISGDAQMNEETEKKKKKKVKDNEFCEGVSNNTNNVSNNTQDEKTNKKKSSKKSRVLSREQDECIKSANMGEIFNVELKKRKRNSDNNGFLDQTSEELEEKENFQDNIKETESNCNDTNLEAGSREKLSKRMLKKLKKKQKYEAILKDIEETKSAEPVAKDEEKGDVDVDENQIKESKRHKKRKANAIESAANEGKRLKVEDKNETENGVGPEEEVEEAIQNKCKTKFSWEEVIKEILRNSSDQELSIKRISKKVLAEYQAVKGDRETYEQLISKFNKKINKTPGVRILKNRAKLISDE